MGQRMGHVRFRLSPGACHGDSPIWAYVGDSDNAGHTVITQASAGCAR